MSKMVSWFSILLILGGLLMLLAGCGSATPAAQPAATRAPAQAATQAAIQPPAQAPGNPKLDACSLLTKADAEKILGKPVDDPIRPVNGNQTFSVDSCEYKVTGGTALDNTSLIVMVPSSGDLAIAQTTFNFGKQQAQAAWNAAPVDVPGLGDTAYWVAGSGNNLSILKGNVYINLGASTQKGDSPSQAILDLARAVLGRLP